MGTQIHERFPAITAAATLMALDCGGINATRTLEQMLADLDGVLADWSDHEGGLCIIDTWLARLTPEQLSTVCTGDCTEAAVILVKAPARTAELLDEVFDNVG
jgi:hypothetical protein